MSDSTTPEPAVPSAADRIGSGEAVPLHEPIVIAVDAMGGDYAPTEIVRGVALYLSRHADGENAIVKLVGDEALIRKELESVAGLSHIYGNHSADRLQIVPASQVIGMDEHPTQAIREKPDASLVICNQLIRRGEAHASFSAGNTGAFMVSATQILERIENVKRPAIATLFPKETGGRAVVVDAGANVDCRPSMLLQFALLGSIYASSVLGMTNPRIGLLSNGEEDAKGNELTHEARKLLVAARPMLNFVGNVEGNHVFEGRVDVIVCDGFAGNVLLKGAEGVVRLTLSLLAAEAKSATDETVRQGLLAALLKLRSHVDYSEFGGAPLLGVNGAVFIAHGRSDSRAIATGIRIAARASRTGYVASIRAALKGLPA